MIFFSKTKNEKVLQLEEMQLANIGRFKYACSFSGCELHFKRKDQLDSHEYTHSQVKKFKCPEVDCSKSYVNNAHLQRHIRTFHKQSNDIIQCEYENCAAFFNSEFKLKVHMNKIHTGRCYQFECDICSQKFRRKTKLRQHMFLHTGNYNYNCSKCEKGFLQLGHLKRHEKSHDLRQCNQCDAKFEKWSSLVDHRQKEHSNSRNKCDICGKVLHSKRGLQHHRLIHTEVEERNVYHCTFEECPKYFFHRNSALTHFKSKHEKRSFICPEDNCGQRLSTKQKLKQHILALHSSKNDCTDNVEQSKTCSAKRRQTERKDKGVQRISTASKLFNIVLPIEMERAIITGKADNVYLGHDQGEENQENLSSSVLRHQVKSSR